jgi:hypothetical protein
MANPAKSAVLQSQQFQNVPDAPAVEYSTNCPGFTKPANPKQAYGDKKPPLAYIPLSAQLAELEALYDGLLKYDPLNWRDNPVEAMTYVEAAMRHLQLWKVGEELTRDTLVKNLGAVKACCTILIDAAAHGTLIDNRPKSKVEADLLHEAEAWVARLKTMQAERETAK